MSERIKPAEIGARIREIRRSAGLTQAQLAERIGLSQPNIAAWETGAIEPRVSAWFAIVDACADAVAREFPRNPPKRARRSRLKTALAVPRRGSGA